MLVWLEVHVRQTEDAGTGHPCDYAPRGHVRTENSKILYTTAITMMSEGTETHLNRGAYIERVGLIFVARPGKALDLPEGILTEKSTPRLSSWLAVYEF